MKDLNNIKINIGGEIIGESKLFLSGTVYEGEDIRIGFLSEPFDFYLFDEIDNLPNPSIEDIKNALDFFIINEIEGKHIKVKKKKINNILDEYTDFYEFNGKFNTSLKLENGNIVNIEIDYSYDVDKENNYKDTINSIKINEEVFYKVK